MPDFAPSLTRRAWLGAIVRGAAAASVVQLLAPKEAFAGAIVAPPTPILVHKDASCVCCAKWVEHLRAHGFRPTVRDEASMDAVKQTLGVPSSLQSCHTAIVAGYVIEGHVPAADIRRLLGTRPKVVGLAVPGMVTGSPGMESPGRPAERYDVLAFDTEGRSRVFAKH